MTYRGHTGSFLDLVLEPARQRLHILLRELCRRLFAGCDAVQVYVYQLDWSCLLLRAAVTQRLLHIQC